MTNREPLTVGSCFSGIGGLELGLEKTGRFKTIWQIENNDYASAVLKKHWPDAKRYSDIRDVSFPARVDVVAGGFPCQDVSLAGARSGLAGRRSTLWGEMHRLVCEVKPRWVLAENVPGLISSDHGQFFGNILRDLARAGYDVEWGVFSAAAVGAPHLRRRIFMLGHSLFGEEWSGDMANAESGEPRIEAEREGRKNTGRGSEEVAHAAGRIRQRETSGESRYASFSSKNMANTIEQQRNRWSDWTCGWKREPQEALQDAGRDGRQEAWMSIPESLLGRVANGVPSRVDRLRCLGNAVVPQVAQKIGEMILKFHDK